MKKRLFFLVLFISLFFISFAKNPIDKFFTKANKFLENNVENGLVDYVALIKDPEELDELVLFISTLSVKEEKSEVQKAFYINAYNLLVIKSIISNYPVLYPLEEIGLFSATKYKVGNEPYTLNELQGKLNQFGDVRIVFVLSFGSIGSPQLASFAYLPSKLEKQIEERTKEVCNNQEFIRVAKNTSTVLMGEAFKRTQIDFNKQDIITCINRFREQPLPVGYRIDFYPSNRNLNDKKTKGW